jgi:hypothetical protein
MFRRSEKGLKGDPLCFGSPEGKSKSEKKKPMQMRLKLVFRKDYTDSRAYYVVRNGMDTLMQPGTT